MFWKEGVLCVLYDVIVLGATFAAAGIAVAAKDSCLVLDSRPQAGYEFLNALSFGTNYDSKPITPEGKALEKAFHARGVFRADTPNLFPCAPVLYGLLQDKHVLLNMQILSVVYDVDCFTVTAHGVSGYRIFQAKQVVDTRTHANQLLSSSLNMIINCPSGTAPSLPAGLRPEPTATPTDFLIRCPVKPDRDYLKARAALAAVIRQLPEHCKLLLTADCFDDTISGQYPMQKDGILYLPSKQFANPIAAFDAGVHYWQGGAQ